MNFTSLLNTIVTLAILLAVGFGCRRWGLIDSVFSKKLSTLIVKIGQPMLIISSLISLEFSRENLKRGAFALLLSFALHLIMGVLAHFIARPLKDADERKISEFAIVFTNCGFIGFPIIESLYGEEGLFCGAFYLLGFHLFVWTWGIFILSRGREDIKLTPKSVLVNFGTIPCLIGFLMFLFPYPFPQFVSQTAGYIADICTPLTMIITGALIATGSVKDLLGRAGNYLVSAARLVILPMIVCVILRLAGLSEYYIVFGTVMAAMPSAAVVTMLCEMHDIKPGYASGLVGVTSLLCIVTLPIMVAFAGFVAGL